MSVSSVKENGVNNVSGLLRAIGKKRECDTGTKVLEKLIWCWW
jgi:hypothetical protein